MNLKQKFLLFVLVLSFSFIPRISESSIFVDFESFGIGTDGPHVFATPSGNLTFDSRVDNTFNGGSIADHTIGDGSNFMGRFWKNTTTTKTMVMTSDFDIDYISLFGYGLPQTNYTVELFDRNDSSVFFFSSSSLTENWLFFEGTASPSFTKFVLTSFGNGDDLAVDDLTVNPAAVPEPLSLVLLGSGLIGSPFLRRKLF